MKTILKVPVLIFSIRYLKSGMRKQIKMQENLITNF